MVFREALMPSSLCSSTSAAAGPPPLPLSPWHAAHFSAKIGAPCADVPLPFGNPVPSGSMLMSQLAIAASSSGLPRCGVSAFDRLAVVASKSIAANRMGLGVDMFDLAIRCNAPTRDRVVVLIGEAQYRRRLGQFTAHGDKFGARRLHVARLVPRPALQRGRTAVPAPWHAETREGLAQDGLLERGLAPALSAVGRNHHLLDPPCA